LLGNGRTATSNLDEFHAIVQFGHRPVTMRSPFYWYYNSWDFNVLSAIFEKKTRLKIGEAFLSADRENRLACEILGRTM
jgi:hypothetical protein